MLAVIIQSCDNSKDNNSKIKHVKSSNEISKKEKSTENEEKKKELTEKEVLNKVENFLKINRKKFQTYGVLENREIKSGDYNGDNSKDYIVTIHFHEDGSDYFNSFYFYVSSLDNELVYLSTPNVGTEKQFLVRKIEKNKIFVTFFIGDPVMGEKDFNSIIQIEKDKVKFKESDIEKADKLMNELMNEYTNSQFEQ